MTTGIWLDTGSSLLGFAIGCLVFSVHILIMWIQSTHELLKLIIKEIKKDFN